MINQSPFRSSKSRLTRQEEGYLRINDQIIEHIRCLSKPEDAETIWLELKMKGMEMSISTFHTRLRKLVEADVVKKKTLGGYNKHGYYIAPPNNK